MNKQFDDTNRGAIFKNKKKESENHPDGTGQLNVKCPHCGESTDFWVSSWNKTSKAGEPFRSLSVKPKDLKASAPIKNVLDKPFHDDDLPW